MGGGNYVDLSVKKDVFSMHTISKVMQFAYCIDIKFILTCFAFSCTLNGFTRNGVDKSGLYCVISAVIERLQIEQDVAISQVIEEMRNAREQIIPSVVSVGLNLKSFYIFH
jgi:hypothetical protein